MIRIDVHKCAANLVDPSKPWCVQWQRDTMPAPAYWFYATREEAESAAKRWLAPLPRAKDTATTH